MTAIGALLSGRDRQRLLEHLAEREDIRAPDDRARIAGRTGRTGAAAPRETR